MYNKQRLLRMIIIVFGSLLIIFHSYQVWCRIDPNRPTAAPLAASTSKPAQQTDSSYDEAAESLARYWREDLAKARAISILEWGDGYSTREHFTRPAGSNPLSDQQLAIFEQTLLTDIKRGMRLGTKSRFHSGAELALEIANALDVAGLKDHTSYIPICSRVKIQPRQVHREGLPYLSKNWVLIWQKK